MPPNGVNISHPEVLSYAQGAAITNTGFLADIIAPVAPVASPQGKFKKYDVESAFLEDLETSRAPGAEGLMIEFDASDPSFNCEPHAVNVPVDVINVDQIGYNYAMMQAADMASFAKGLSHERAVFKLAKALLASNAVVWNAASKPLETLDAALRAVVLGSFGGFGLEAHIIFGMAAWQRFKSNASVSGKFVVNTSKNAGAAFAIPAINSVGSMTLVESQAHLSLVVQNEAKQGLAKSMNFVTDDEVFVFMRPRNPNQLDAGFMKTFRLNGRYMSPRTWKSPSGRNEFAAYDWSVDVQGVNAGAGYLITTSDS